MAESMDQIFYNVKQELGTIIEKESNQKTKQDLRKYLTILENNYLYHKQALIDLRLPVTYRMVKNKLNDLIQHSSIYEDDPIIPQRFRNSLLDVLPSPYRFSRQ